MSRSGVCTPEYDAETKRLQERVEKLREQLRATARDAAKQTRLEHQTEELKAQREEGRAKGGVLLKEKKAKPSHEYNEATRQRELEMQRIKREVEGMIEKGERLNQSAGKKVLELWHSMHLFDIFTSPFVYPKLAAAVVGGHIHAVSSAATISALKAVFPGIRRLAEMSERYGAGLTAEGMKARFGEGIKQAPARGLQTLKQGASNVEAALGDPSHATDAYVSYLGTMREALDTPGFGDKAFEVARVVLSYPGRSHGFVKQFLSSPGFEHSYVDRGIQMSRALEKKFKAEGMDAEAAKAAAQEVMSRETTRASLGAKAVADSYEEKMQGKNRWNDAALLPIQRMSRSDNLGANAAAFVFRSVFPVVRVGANVVKQMGSIFPGGGLIKAGLKTAEAKRTGWTPEHVDYVLKNLGAQGTGLAMIGAYLVLKDLGLAKFGGVPGDKKNKPGDVKADEAEIGGVPIGTWGFHGAPMALFQLAEGMHRVYEEHANKGEPAGMAAAESLVDNLKEWTERTLPYTEEARRIYNTLKYNPRGWGAVAGDQLRSMTVPLGLQQVAKEKDPYKGFRRPKNIAQDIEVGLPGNEFLGMPAREQVPKR